VFLYLPDITQHERSMTVEPLFIGEDIGGGARLSEHRLSVRYYRAAETVVLTVEGSFVTKTACHRCGDPVEVTVEMNEQFILFPAQEGDDLDYTYEGEEISLDPFIHEALVLNIPAKIVCDEACKGLCPVCGVNRNRVACACIPHESDR